MIEVACPKPAYERIVKSGLDKRIKEAKDRLFDIVMGGVNQIGGEEIFEHARKYFRQSQRISERSALYKDILKLDEIIESESFFSEEKDELLIKHPSLLAFAVLGEEVLNFRKYGFETRSQLEESIAGFCLGERWAKELFGFRDKYFWRNGNYKNELTNSYHGDCWAHQTDVSGKDTKQKTLFGEVQVFDTWKDVSGKIKGINADWTDWSNFLIASLRYAEAIGKAKMPEIINWRGFLREIGSVGTMTAEAEFGDASPDWALDELMRAQLLNSDVEKIEEFPICIVGGGDRKNIYFPYVSDGRLLYLRETPEGEIQVKSNCTLIQDKRFSPHLVYDESDLPHLLKGTYSLFARDRSLLPKIIDRFIAETNS